MIVVVTNTDIIRTLEDVPKAFNILNENYPSEHRDLSTVAPVFGSP